jgi:hypothetical protein
VCSLVAEQVESVDLVDERVTNLVVEAGEGPPTGSLPAESQ